jgi:dienelactone hydrolase
MNPYLCLRNAGCRRLFAFASAVILATLQCLADSPPDVRVGPCLAIGKIGSSSRSPVHTDAIEAGLISGNWRPPAEGDRLRLPDGASSQWHQINPNKDGWFDDDRLKGGYAYAPVTARSNCVLILVAEGDSLAYVNGAPRAGDPYEYGYVHLPVPLHAGTNDFLFVCGGGRLKFTLTAPPQPVSFNLADTTLPDLIAGSPRGATGAHASPDGPNRSTPQGERMDTWGAVVVVNATGETQTGLSIRASIAGKHPVQTPVPAILPFSVRKVGFRLRGKVSETTTVNSQQIRAVLPDTPRDESRETWVNLQLTLVGKAGERHGILDSVSTRLRVRRADQIQKRTFISDIDGSVQYWALNPAQPVHRKHPPLALFFSLHGAGVEALGQAEAYEPKSWGNLVVPTNRRPFGFDWEDWGRLDALEVLNLAESELHPDPQRIYLTGHSMGGHGAWQLGALFPDRWAADGVSAGWISFFSYVGGARFTNATPMEAMLQRAAAASDTLLMQSNFLQEGVYILHGSKDDNVPVTEAQHMSNVLSRFDHDFVFHEQPGVGHWWDLSDEPGADCVDWPPMFDYFARHAIPTDESLRDINFTTVNPGVSASCHWLEIGQQMHPLQPSSADVRWDPGKRRFVGATANIARLAFALNQVEPDRALEVELDGQTNIIPWPTNADKLWLQNAGGRWRVTSKPSAALKGPLRDGPFKDAFRHRMIFVYGTKGTPDENAWAFEKARFDGETFWYRGNGSVDVVPDTKFNPHAQPDRGVILYGNADSNGAWPALLGDSPVQVSRNEVKIGGRVLTGDDLACLFLRPRPGSDVACVGVVSGTGLAGMKLTNRLNYFLSGVAYPDCTVIGPERLSQGVKGVRAAGFFGNDWSVDNGDFSWREP